MLNAFLSARKRSIDYDRLYHPHQQSKVTTALLKKYEISEGPDALSSANIDKLPKIGEEKPERS